MVSVAQLVEHRSVAPRVAGSNPVAHPNFPNYFSSSSIASIMFPDLVAAVEEPERTVGDTATGEIYFVTGEWISAT